MNRAFSLRPGDRVRTDDGRSGFVREMVRFIDLDGENARKSEAVVMIGGVAVVKRFTQLGAA